MFKVKCAFMCFVLAFIYMIYINYMLIFGHHLFYTIPQNAFLYGSIISNDSPIDRGLLYSLYFVWMIYIPLYFIWLGIRELLCIKDVKNIGMNELGLPSLFLLGSVSLVPLFCVTAPQSYPAYFLANLDPIWALHMFHVTFGIAFMFGLPALYYCGKCWLMNKACNVQ